MSKERFNYYPNANVLPPRRVFKHDVEAENALVKTPNSPIQRPDRNCKFRKSGKGIEFCRYEYYVPNDQHLMPNIIVARDPRYPNQRCIGPSDSVHKLMFSLNLLERFYPNSEFRDMDLVFGAKYSRRTTDKNNYQSIQGNKYVTKRLLDQTGISEKLFKTKFQKPNIDAPNAGCYCDIEAPVFFMTEPLISFGYDIVHFAHDIVHDWTHVVQSRLGKYNVQSRAIEIQAIANGHNFTASILRLPFFNFLTNRDQYLLSLFLKRGEKHIKSYMKGGSGHVSSKNLISAAEDQDLDRLPLNLYKYGRISFNA